MKKTIAVLLVLVAGSIGVLVYRHKAAAVWEEERWNLSNLCHDTVQSRDPLDHDQHGWAFKTDAGIERIQRMDDETWDVSCAGQARDALHYGPDGRTVITQVTYDASTGKWSNG